MASAIVRLGRGPTFFQTLSSALFVGIKSIAFRFFNMGIGCHNQIEDHNGPSVVVIETARHMQVLYRSMLSGKATRTLRIFSDPQQAIGSIIADPPDVLLVDWHAQSLPGNRFLNQFRSRQLYPVCLVPVIMVMSEVRQRTFEQAIKLGAHAVLAKPISTSQLFDYIAWVSREDQQMELSGDRYVVSNLVERVKNNADPAGRRESEVFTHNQQMAKIESLQSDVDRILRSSFY
jgi:DNA-binding NtrC family response regulator